MPLTLNIDPAHVARLKDHAHGLRLSASRLVSQFIDDLTTDEKPPPLGIVVGVLRKNRVHLSNKGLLNIAVFGSVARGQEGPGSDVDLLVNVSNDMTVFRLASLKAEIQGLLETDIDLVTLDEFRKRFDKSVQEDIVVAY